LGTPFDQLDASLQSPELPIHSVVAIAVSQFVDEFRTKAYAPPKTERPMIIIVPCQIQVGRRRIGS
jgi:hypothetical protein